MESNHPGPRLDLSAWPPNSNACTGPHRLKRHASHFFVKCWFTAPPHRESAGTVKLHIWLRVLWALAQCLVRAILPQTRAPQALTEKVDGVGRTRRGWPAATRAMPLDFVEYGTAQTVEFGCARVEGSATLQPDPYGS